MKCLGAFALGLAALNASAIYESPVELRFPYVSTYYVEPTVSPAADTKIGYYVTDWDHSLVRFGDDSKRFNVYLRYSTNRIDWTELTQENVISGDHEFNLGRLPVGDYVLSIRTVELESGLSSHTVYHEFRSRTPESVAISEAETYRMTEADLATYGITPEVGRFSFHMVNLTDDENSIAKTNETEYLAAVDRATAGVTPASGTYEIYAPAYTNKLYYKGFKRSRVIYAADYDFAAVENEATNNVRGLQRLIDDTVANGYRKLVLLPRVYRISGYLTLKMRSNLTVDLNGATLKNNGFTGASGTMVYFDNVHDSALVNGTLDGEYYEHDYANSPNNSEWPLGFKIAGDCRYCTVDGVKVHNITGYGQSNGFGGSAGHCFPGSSGLNFKGKNSYTAGSLNLADGSVDETISNSFVSVYRDISKFTNHYVTVSKYLGYQGIRTKSWYYKAAFYDADKNYLHGEVAFQYRDVAIPRGAKYMRIAIEETSLSEAENCELTGQLFTIPRNCVMRNIDIFRCRCVGMAPAAMRNMLIENNEFSFSGDAAATCAFDAEDGWDQMQDVFIRNNYFHDNNNAELLTCAGHNFVFENNRANMTVYARTMSPCVRSNVCGRASYECKQNRNRTMHGRYIGNKFRDTLSFGGSDEDIGWTIVTSDPIKSYVDGKQLSYSPSFTGRFRDTYLENVKLQGGAGVFDGIAFTNCHFVMTFTSWNFSGCDIVDTLIQHPNKENWFSDCYFLNSKLSCMSGGTLHVYDTVFENFTADTGYWSKPNTYDFDHITVCNTQTFWKVAAYSTGTICVRSSAFDTGAAPAFNLWDLRAQDTDVQTGKVIFVQSEFSSAPAVKAGAKTSTKRIEFYSYASKVDGAALTETNQFLNPIPPQWPITISQTYVDDPELEPTPLPGQLTTNAMKNASWGYTVSGLGSASNEVACVFTNITEEMYWSVPANALDVKVLVVGGGGAGGASDPAGRDRAGGGGGAGGLKYISRYAVKKFGMRFPVSVGAGGDDSNGGDSSFGDIIAHGGGRGGSFSAGNAGGSGGGGSCGPNRSTNYAGGGSNADPIEFGNHGGCGKPSDDADDYGAGGGGGGAGDPGSDAVTNDKGGNGGEGLEYSLLGYPVVYCSGGGGGSTHDNTVGKGGTGAGDGGNYGTVRATDATGYGCGGGGADGTGKVGTAARHGGKGGNGIVIVRYKRLLAPRVEELIRNDFKMELMVKDGKLDVRVPSSNIGYRYGYRKSSDLTKLADAPIVWLDTVTLGDGKVTLELPREENDPGCFYKIVIDDDPIFYRSESDQFYDDSQYAVDFEKAYPGDKVIREPLIRP